MQFAHLRCLSLPALALAAAGNAWAEGEQDFRFTAGFNAAYNSNLFLLPSGANTQALIGSSSPADTTFGGYLGINYNKTYSLQRFELDASVVNYRYQKFSYLDFLGFNYNAAWRWSYTPQLYGNLSATREDVPNSYAYDTNFTSSNQRIRINYLLDATYEVDANWRALGGVVHSSTEYSNVTRTQNNYRQTAGNVGVRYELASGSSAGYRFTGTNGVQTGLQQNLFNLFERPYDQTDNNLLLKWAINRDATANFMAGYTNRKYPDNPRRDYGGLVGNATLNWALSGKSAVNAGWNRTVYEYQTAVSNYTQDDTLYISPVWQISPMATISLRLDHTIRNFRGSPTALLTSDRRDNTTNINLSFGWQPYNYLLVNASVQNGQRTSNTPGNDYKNNTFSLNAQFSY